MNPLDLKGPEFLVLYCVVLLVAVGIAAALRRALRLPDDDPSLESLNLSPYEVAYLAGGKELIVNAAIARLVQQDIVAVNALYRKLTLGNRELGGNSSKLDQAVLSALNCESSETIANVRSQVMEVLAPIEQRLRELELLVLESRAWNARIIPVLLVLSVALVGVLKIIVGISRDKPVTLLVILCFITVAVALVGFARQLHRSRRGDRALDRLRETHAALESTSRQRAHELASDDLVLAVGLFGMSVLAGGPLAELQAALKPPAGSGGGCGTGGGGCGGGGGGGCGGCSG